MFMKLASCAALTLCALTANAADQAYEWSFQGFAYKGGPDFFPDAKITGQFVVNDLNQDGIFDLTEVKSFTYDMVGKQPCINAGNITCSLSTFSYNPAGALSFDYEFRRSSESSGHHDWVHSGKNWGYAMWWGGDGEDVGYTWDARTVATITAVPEPHSYLMLGAGLLSLAAFTRRRRNRK
ncbi:PEP-CTERM sorting domain-containing protein [Massilia frigida]|nr:PEP-CTERM sorting domain-containing protein [Massilia frigida]